MSNPETTQELTPRQKQALNQEGTRPGPVFRPEVDILESREGYTLYVDLPGVDEKNLDVRLENGTLTLDAPAPAAAEWSATPLHTEYQDGGYHREFRISDRVDATSVSARMRNGVLELQLPKSEAHKPRTIEVHAG